MVYTTVAPRAIWSSNTANKGVAKGCMQPDGNFVLYTASSSVVWATDSANSPRAYLEMQDDGQVVVWFNGIKKFSSGVTAECVKPA